MRRRDAAFVLALGLWLAGLVAFRAAVIEPRAWAEACAAGGPWPCLARGAALWLQQDGLWGAAALAAGLAAQFGAPCSVLAVALGLAGVVNYDASFAMLGLALGAWAWISPPGRASAG